MDKIEISLVFEIDALSEGHKQRAVQWAQDMAIAFQRGPRAFKLLSGKMQITFAPKTETIHLCPDYQT